MTKDKIMTSKTTSALQIRDMMKEMIWGLANDGAVAGEALMPAEFPEHIATWIEDSTVAWYLLGISTSQRTIGRVSNDRGEKLAVIVRRACEKANEFFPVYSDEWLAIVASVITTTINIEEWK